MPALRKRHQDDVRKKIQADRLIAYLHSGIFDTKYQGKNIELTKVKVSAINVLLNKCLPDLRAVELTGAGGGDLIIQLSAPDAEA